MLWKVPRTFLELSLRDLGPVFWKLEKVTIIQLTQIAFLNLEMEAEGFLNGKIEYIFILKCKK